MSLFKSFGTQTTRAEDHIGRAKKIVQAVRNQQSDEYRFVVVRILFLKNEKSL